ncbi:hypothetical protein PPSIR1_41084 [Plesiocystis pacifica SIR-1]|uniref:DUF2330 domain-containing protein n=2 Tax=Plesiocystis pacifica TaxID=191768 RepID=A6GIP8_9BACT|nr:DUF2330 domain-containing protein [Plesiocystis pacifica]EDM74236.1 hypothetical protein PPSIR1_41084 [Plesiocystis pacifica SIR-1]
MPAFVESSPRSRRRVPAALALALLALIALLPAPVQAFCGFYVADADTEMFNDATVVVLMRQGQRTVLSMQNSYAGPPEDFAMVVPVPVVLQEHQVVTLPQGVFERIDRLSAPRLVEYWERDPCESPMDFGYGVGAGAIGLGGSGAGFGLAAESVSPPRPVVKVESEFVVGEYDIVVLSAEDSVGLETWLHQEGYQIPKGAEKQLRPYVQQGYKFFVAKVDVSKVKFVDGRVALSPLRMHYDSDSFSLPIRLGLINASKQGPQDLIVHILADDRYEVANYPNVAIPTNIEVKKGARKHFGSFYASLLDETLDDHPGAVVTEYAWSSRKCDPCPVRPLGTKELRQLGADVMPGGLTRPTLTRLHARYRRGSVGNDLVFQVAKPIAGGRERLVGDDGKLERGTVSDGTNNFQARYIIRHYWPGPIECKAPQRFDWGGPWPSLDDSAGLEVARDTAFTRRRLDLDDYVREKDAKRLSVKLLSKGDRSIAPPPIEQPRARANAEPPVEIEEDSPDEATGGEAAEGEDSSGLALRAAGGGLGAFGLGLVTLFGVGTRRRARHRTRPTRSSHQP